MPTDHSPNSAITYTKHGENDVKSIKVFGFWVYLMSDCILFSALFATYAVLSKSVVDGPTGREIFKLPLVLVETFFLLSSSLTYGIAIQATGLSNEKWGKRSTYFLGLTFFFGLSFICMELYEFNCLISEGYGPDHSAFLSGFFALVGTHGLHVISGLIWILVMIVQISQRGLTAVNKTRLQCLGLFWHFLDIVWICLFTVVYLMGVL